MQDDVVLLREFASNRSGPAFAELVRRHLPAVYGVALRRLGGDAGLAQEVAQHVFVLLARKAAVLAQRDSIAGWLFVAARLAAADAARREGRRRQRLQEAQAMIERTATATNEPDWAPIRQELDEIIQGLNARDREAVLLRFFQHQTFADIAVTLRISENGARMRVDRAVKRMRQTLARRGIASGAAMLAGALSAQTTVAVPGGLPATVAAAGVAAHAAPSGMLLWLINVRWEMGLTAAILGAVAMGGLELRANHGLEHEVTGLESEASALPRLRQEYVMAQRNEAAADTALQVARQHERTSPAEAATILAPGHKPIATLTEAMAAGPLVDESSLPRPLKPVDQTIPKYPPTMLKLKASGTVIVSLIVTADGGVIEARVKSSTRPEFEESALQAVSLWLFTPPTLNGAPVNVRTEVPMEFKIHK